VPRKKGAAANLARIALNAGRRQTQGGTETADIITFIQSDWGLGIKLFPVQRVILKAHYGLELDDDPENTFPVTDWKRENVQHLTEAEYLRWLYEEGRCNISEVTPGQERRNLILPIGRRSGKCVVGDTLLLTNEGVRQIRDYDTIDSYLDFPDEDHYPLVLTVAQEGAQVRSESSYFYRGGHRDIVRMRTACGFEIAGTPNHRIKVMGADGKIQWRRLDELQINDQVAVHRNTDLWASDYVNTTELAQSANQRGRKNLELPAKLDEEWGLLLGLLAGDGNWPSKNTISMTVEHEELWEKASTLFAKLLGEPSRVMDKLTANTGALQFYSVAARFFLHGLGFDWNCDRYNKRIPHTIMRSPRPVVQAFLRGLFETGGGVEAGGKTVSFSTASSELAREVQVLLLNLGIVSRRKSKWNAKTKRDYYVVSVRGLRSRTLFAERVGFMSHKKMDPLCESIHVASREGGDTESIPHQREWCRRLLESTPKGHKSTGKGWQRSKLRDKLGNSIKPSAKDEMSYPRWEQARVVACEVGADPDLIAHFDAIAEADYFYDPVVSLAEDEATVYDLCVPDGASFVANGLTNHNTMISACIAAYETYKLINKGNPQKYYGVAPSNPIRLVSVATGKEQAGLLYEEVSHHFAKCNFFRRYTANNTMSYARFQTPNDIEEFGSYSENPQARASIKVFFAACNAKSLRGQGNIVIILDEVAHFLEQGGSSAEEVYGAVSPSNAAFSPKDEFGKPIDGDDTPSDGRIIMISSPLGKQGLFYQKFRQGMAGGAAAENILCVQAPTWEVNPTIPAGYFKEQYAFDPRMFRQEFGAEFTDRTLGWLDDPKDLFDCVDKTARAKSRGTPRIPYFAGFDLGLAGDASALAITHIDEEQRIVLDYIGQIKAGVGEFEGKDRLDFEEVAAWIHVMSRRFRIHRGLLDQHYGIPLEQALHKKGLSQFEMKLFTPREKSDIWANMKAMMWDRVGGKPRLVLYDITDREKAEYVARDEKPPEHLEYIQQILSLQATYKSQYIVDVQAPQTEGKHDDLADALSRSVYLASQHLGKLKHIARTKGQSVVPGQHTVSAQVRRAARRKRMLGGSDPKRQVAKKRRY